jgi:hypothetical protein
LEAVEGAGEAEIVAANTRKSFCPSECWKAPCRLRRRSWQGAAEAVETVAGADAVILLNCRRRSLHHHRPRRKGSRSYVAEVPDEGVDTDAAVVLNCQRKSLHGRRLRRNGSRNYATDVPDEGMGAVTVMDVDAVMDAAVDAILLRRCPRRRRQQKHRALKSSSSYCRTLGSG